MSGSHAGHSHAQGNAAPGGAGERSALTRRAAMASMGTALFLLGLKGWAAYTTGSIAMLGSLADTALDLVASLVTFLGVLYAAQPADDEHRFGHGKAEALAALVQVGLISVSATGIALRAIDRLRNPAPVSGFEEGVAVSIIAMVATLALLAYQRRVLRATGSVAIHADHVHYQSDLLLNGAVIAALALDALTGFRQADPLFGLLIAAWLVWGAWQASRAALDQLLDREWSPERRAAFTAAAAAHPAVAGVHDLRTRTSGGHDFAQFHIWVRPDMTVREVHGVMDAIEARLATEFPGVEVLIHPDPEGHSDDLAFSDAEGSAPA